MAGERLVEQATVGVGAGLVVPPEAGDQAAGLEAVVALAQVRDDLLRVHAVEQRTRKMVAAADGVEVVVVKAGHHGASAEVHGRNACGPC